MSLRGFEHVGTTTADLDRAIAFYCGLLGCGWCCASSRAKRRWRSSTRAAACSKSRNARAPAGHMTSQREWPGSDAMVARLAAAGVEIIEQPRNAHNTELIRRVAFCRDPDGIQVELIERQAGR